MTAERCRASQYALAARGSQANSIRVRLATLGSFGKWPRVRLSRPADPQRGESVYAMKCAACHGPDGQGRRGANGEYLSPALWGPESFNIGAGMARLSNAAGFVKTNMPLGKGEMLTDADAIDVAAYFMRQPRPDFPAKLRDWPKGGKPDDAPY